MATDISDSFVRQYEKDLIHVFQREGGALRPTVRMKTGVVGTSTTFQRIGTGVATTKARHGLVTPMNQTHTPIECTISDFYAGDYVDKLDEAKINIDERMAIAEGGAWALGRKVDDQIITVLDTTTEAIVSWTVTSEATTRNSLISMAEALDDNDVPRDGRRYALLTPRAWSQAAVIEEFSSADYVGPQGQSLREGAPPFRMWKEWESIKWGVHTGLPGKGTATAKVFAWHQRAVGYATGAHAMNNAENDAVRAEITYNGERVSHFVNHFMSGGACLIDTTGVIEGNLNDTTAIATS